MTFLVHRNLQALLSTIFLINPVKQTNKEQGTLQLVEGLPKDLPQQQLMVFLITRLQPRPAVNIYIQRLKNGLHNQKHQQHGDRHLPNNRRIFEYLDGTAACDITWHTQESAFYPLCCQK